MFDFPASGQTSTVRRRPLLPLAASVAIHAAVVMFLLALTFSNGLVERAPQTRATILFLRLPLIHAATPAFKPGPHAAAALRKDRTLPRLFRTPVIRAVTAPLREPAPVLTLQIPLPEVSRPLLPSADVARLPVAPAPPLRTDNLVSLAVRAPLPAASAIAVSRPAGFAAATSAISRTLATLRSSGFEQIAAAPAPRPQTPPHLAQGFDDATMVLAGQPHRAGVAPAPPVTRLVEILSKPRPAYTEEARRLRIEGEVLLDILFAASGQVHVLGTVRGLGHGLDESAIAAAEAIRFRPAERAGVAVDSTALVHIEFQLAY